MSLESVRRTVTEGSILDKAVSKVAGVDVNLTGVLSGWTGQGLANIDVAYYKLTGQNEKAIDTQIN